MKKLLWSGLLLLILSSCVVDYNVGLVGDIENMIVVNGYLDPEDPITLHLYKHGENKQAKTVGLLGAHLLLSEDGNVLYDDICTDSIFTLNYYPKIGATYTLEVSTSGFETVNAKTTVPHSVECEGTFERKGEKWWDSRGDLVTLNNFKFNNSINSAMWVLAFMTTDEGEVTQYSDLYINNVYVDKTNQENGMAPNEVVGIMYNNGYMRFKSRYKENLSKEGIVFTPSQTLYANYPDIVENQSGIRIDVISASPEFDKYNKSMYDQKMMIVYEEDISSVFYQPKGVYTNVNNGTGIFAGVSKTVLNFEYPQRDDK